MTILLALFILFYCIRKPIIGLALLLQINIIRAFAVVDYNNPVFDTNESDIILGAITPILAFVIIILRFNFKKKVHYVIDEFDWYFVFTIVVLFFSSLYAPNFIEAIGYSFKYLLIGSSFYFISKIIIINTVDYRGAVNTFFKTTLILSLIFGCVASYLYVFKGGTANRLTFPGVHPIPFSQLIGLGVLISFMIFITNGSLFNIKSKLIFRLNIIVLPILTLILFGTNTRGVMMATAVAAFIYLLIAKVKIKKRTLYVVSALMIVGLVVAINYIDFEVLFSRILWRGTSKSGDDRLIAYIDSLYLFITHPLGVGPDGFKHYSTLPYPHNFFLENIANYGIFGLFLDLYFFLMGALMFLITLKNRHKDIMIVFLFVVYFYFFIEAMFSFTLWMHKGLYLSIGLFVAYYYRFKKSNSTV